MKIGSPITLIAIASVAFFVADVAHEGLGHGGACLASGGRMLSLSSTYEQCSVRSRWIDAAGPGVGILVALLAFGWLRWARPRSQNMRSFLCLLFAFAIFWNVGYMVYSGLLHRGDWKFVIAGLEPAAVWRAALVAGGVILYAVAMRTLSALLARHFAENDEGWRPHTFALVALTAATLLAAVGGTFDPRGRAIIFTDALPSALSSFGLVWVGLVLSRRWPNLRIATPASPTWIGVGFVCAAIFVAVLGPGLRF